MDVQDLFKYHELVSGFLHLLKKYIKKSMTTSGLYQSCRAHFQSDKLLIGSH